ncbi:LysM peptidoglycan-binding domain-containing protein [Lutimaribacter saemankumensis]|uniref:Nucleoid-associated protein YgaU, contains BON and LysM domains n=1 Tax=Lutimaribacter saemankumensis TaxID=490829 RepID=A0A1G8H3W7_9RHOB|nr:LysM peptidoglycan-binding domain-containing protein [Lutimaribacter saemankumensis]SDI01303.1 Nucleoid-associated protein YgaU, contains BON and LysM domains [Lutimaribacter saemankumensis]
MSKFANLSGPGAVLAGGVAAAVVAAIGFLIWNSMSEPLEPLSVATAPKSSQSDSTTTQAAPAPTVTPDQDTPATATQTDSAEPAAPQDTAQAATPEPPRFALVRVESDGFAQVAGTATPGGRVELLLEGEVVGEATAGADGSFAALIDLPPSDTPRMMRLRVAVDGGNVDSDEEVIIAPTAAASEPVVASSAPQQPTAQPPVAQAPATQEQPAEQTAQVDPDDAQPTAPAVLISDAQGVRVLQPSANADAASPEVMSSVAIDAITYSESGDVELAGRSPGEGFVRVYLDNAPVTTSRIAPDGSWRTDLPEVDSGVYTLRVDQVSAEGDVVSRVETPFKREDAKALAAAGASEQGSVRAITVQPGNTLWAIARDRYGEGTAFLKVFEANRDRIRDPDLIYPGQVFDLPQE